jgi:hypothetical protein
MATTKSSNISGFCLTNDKKMEIGSLLQLVLKDDKIVPMEIVSKYAQIVDQKVKNGSTYRDPVVNLHFLW